MRLVLWLGLAMQACAWNYQGHMVVAGIAQSLLEERENALINQILDGYREPCRGNKSYESFNHPFIECAVYADQIKRQGGQFQQNWHFIDQIYNQSSPTLKDQLHANRELTVVSSIKQLVQILSCGNVYGCAQSLPVYKLISKFIQAQLKRKQEQLLERTFLQLEDVELIVDRKLIQGLALRLLIHYVGDISQPLHTITRVSKQFPNGDMGGNLFNISSPAGFKDIKELHALWDSSLYSEHHVADTPFSEEDWSKFTALIRNLRVEFAAYIESHQDLLEYDPSKWAHDSYEIGTRVYEGVAQNQPVTEEYLDEWRTVAARQQVIAGHRLAAIIKRIYTNQQSIYTNQQRIAWQQMPF